MRLGLDYAHGAFVEPTCPSFVPLLSDAGIPLCLATGSEGGGLVDPVIGGSTREEGIPGAGIRPACAHGAAVPTETPIGFNCAGGMPVGGIPIGACPAAATIG